MRDHTDPQQPFLLPASLQPLNVHARDDMRKSETVKQLWLHRVMVPPSISAAHCWSSKLPNQKLEECWALGNGLPKVSLETRGAICSLPMPARSRGNEPKGRGLIIGKTLLPARFVGAGMGDGHHPSHAVLFHPSTKAKLVVRTRHHSLTGTTEQCQHYRGTKSEVFQAEKKI